MSNTVYFYCISVWLIVMLVTLVLDSFESIAGLIDFDGFDVDIGDLDICVLPISMRAICLASVLFGGIDLLLNPLPYIVRNIIAGIVAYVGAVLVQTFTKYLKKHQSEADDKSLLKYSNCKVVNTIPANGFGSIVAERFGDSSVSLTAKSMSEAEAEKKRIDAQADADAITATAVAQADAIRKKAEAEADAISKNGSAEAEATRAKLLAEAEGLERRAEAMQKMNQAGVTQMIIDKLPEIAGAIAKPIEQIDKISIIGGADGVAQVTDYVPTALAKVVETVKETTGFDLTDAMKANTIQAQTENNVNITTEKK